MLQARQLPTVTRNVTFACTGVASLRAQGGRALPSGEVGEHLVGRKEAWGAPPGEEQMVGRGRREDPYNHGEEQGRREEGRPARDGSRTRWEIIS